MDANLFRYILRHTRKEQIWILCIILISMPIYFLSLDLPKQIVNNPIQGEGFATPDTTQPFLQFTINLPEVLGGTAWTFPGIELERLSYLIALSFSFLALVCVNGLFKYYINTYKGRLGERMLRRIRYELVDRVLRFPYGRFRQIRAPEIATMVKDEVEPLGGFIGDAYVSPVFLGGQALTAMVFIVSQSFTLGLIAGGIVLMQAALIPRLRRRLLQLGKQRQLSARELAGRVGEIVDSIADIRTNDTSNFERAGVSDRLSHIFFIRYEYYQRKFFVKFLNNFLAQVTPFLFYLVGGYFAIRGSLDIGQLVAVIAAYKDLPGPIKELIDWDQRRLDIEIKYTQVVQQFAPEGMIDPAAQVPATEPVPRISGPVVIESVTMIDDSGGKLVEDASFSIAPHEHVATVGEVNSGGEALAEALAGLYPPASGRIMINDSSIHDLGEAITGRRIGYVSSDPVLHNSSLLNCLLYSLKHVPDDSRSGGASLSHDELMEARASGNSLLNIRQDWIDYDAAGCEGPVELRHRLLDLLRIVDLDRDIYDLGLRGTVDHNEHSEWSTRILEARTEMGKALAEPALANLIETFDPNRYNTQMAVSGNLFFGRARKKEFETDQLPANAFFLNLLRDSGLDVQLFDMGRNIASTLVELFADLEPDNPFLNQLTFMTPDELPEYRARLARANCKKHETADEEDRAAFLRLALNYIEPEHRLGLLDDDLRNALLSARATIFEKLPGYDADAVSFYDPDVFNPEASLRDNILFGRAVSGVADGPELITSTFRGILDKLDMNDLVFEAGLEFTVGTAGRRLTNTQRQKVSLTRALLKRPDLLIANHALSSLSARAQTRIMKRVLKDASENAADSGRSDANSARAQFATFWVLMNPANADNFDRVLVFENGRLTENGNPEELLSRSGRFAKMMA